MLPDNPKDLFSELHDATRTIECHARLIGEQEHKRAEITEKLLPLFPTVGSTAFVRPYRFSDDVYQVTRRPLGLHIVRVTVLNMDEVQWPEPQADTFTAPGTPDEAELAAQNRGEDCGGDVTVHPHRGDCGCSLCQLERELVSAGPVS